MADKSLDFKIRLTAEDRAAASLKAAAAAIKEVEAAQRGANTAAQAWQTLGARSGEAIRADMEKVKAALASIRGSGAPIEEMGRATQAASQRLRELGRELALVEKPITGIERLFSKVTQAFLALQVVLQGAEIANAADNFEKLRITLTQSEGSMQGAEQALNELYRIAQSASVPIEAMTVSYQRYTRSVAAMGGSQQEALNFTEALAKALRLSNATAQETGSVMRQLSQAFNKGKLNGDEFVSVSENGGRVLDYLARQLGKSRGELQEMSKAGALTDKVLLELGKALEKIRGDFDMLPKNFTDAWVNFRNGMIDTLGRSAMFQGVMSALTSTLLALANHINLVLVALGALGVAWVMQHTSIGLLVLLWGGLTSAISAATASTSAFTAALWGLAKHPAVLVLGAIVSYIAYDYVAAWLSGEKAQTSALDNLKAKLNEAERKLAELDGAVMKSKQTLEGLFDSLTKEYDKIGGLTNESMEGELAAVRRVYNQELALLQGLVKDKNRARDEETKMLVNQVNKEIAIISQASARKIDLIRQEYTQAMDLARKSAIIPELRVKMEEAAQQKLLAKLKEAWETEAAGYAEHLKTLEGLAIGHLNRIEEIEHERADINRTIEKEIAAIQERSYSASTRLFAEKKTQEQEIAALKDKVAQGDIKAAEELIRIYKEQEAAAKAATQARIIQPGQDGGWYEQSDLNLMQKLTELQEMINQGKDEQKRKEEAALVSAQAQLETMRELVTETRAFGQNVTTSMEAMARMKIGVDSDAFQAEIDKLVKLLAEREDAKLKVKLISEEIDAVKLTKDAEAALGKNPVKAPVEYDLRHAATHLNKDFGEIVKKLEPPPVPVTTEVKDPAAASKDISQDLAKTPAEAEVQLNANVQQFESELTQVQRLTAEREAWLKIRADASQALADLQAFQSQAGVNTESSHTITTNKDQALSEIMSLDGRNTSSTHTIYCHKVGCNSDGGLIGYANGGSASSALFRNFPRRAGFITGPGTETSDSIPAMLSRGEFVIRAAAVRKWGRDFFIALNRGFLPAMPRLAGGGMPMPAIASPAGLPEMAINLSVQGGSPLRVLSSRETAKNLAQALRNLERGR